MARFSLVFAAAGVLLLVAMAAEASPRTTITTTTTTIQENQGSDCFQQLLEQQSLSQCALYLKEYTEAKLPWYPSATKPTEEQKQLCCKQLNNVEDMCVCPGIKMLLNQPLLSQMSQMVGQLYNQARRLPLECNLQLQPCELQPVWF